MKRLLLALLFVYFQLAGLAMAQRTPIATDDFNRASLGTTDWTQLNTDNGSITISASTVVTGSVAGTIRPAARWTGAGTFTDNQYVKIAVILVADNGDSYANGVICRASADTNTTRDYYLAEVHSGGGANRTVQLAKIVNGTRTQRHSASVAWSSGDTIELECNETEIKAMKNGTALGGLYTWTDADLTTGNPGVVASGAAAGTTGDNWEGGNLGAVGGGATGGVSRRRAQ